MDKHVYGFGQKLDFLITIINEQIATLTDADEQYSTLKTLLAETKKLHKEVLDQRNILAHSKVEYDKHGIAYMKGINKRTSKVNPDSKWCVRVRNDLIKHSDNLKLILSHL